MLKEEKKKKKFLERLRTPYLLMVIDEETFEERTQLRFSKLKAVIFTFFLFAFFALSTYSAIVYTPLKEYIPGYDSSELRARAVQNLFLTDSLIKHYNENIEYLNAVRKVLTEDISFEDSNITESDNTSTTPFNSNFTQTVVEDSILRAFVLQEDKYSPIQGIERELKTYLFTPASGPISQPFDVEESHFAVDIALEKNTPIKAIAEGTVIFSEWTTETGFVIILEHSVGMLSVYKHNASLMKKQGEAVLAGEVIAIAGNTGEFTTGYHLHFELWIDGYPMNPENFFNFSGND